MARFLLKAAAALAISAFAVQAASQDAHAQTFQWAFQGDAITMDPHSTTEFTTVGLLANVYEGLVRRDREMKIEPALATDGTAAWLDRIAAAGVPCGPINDLAQVFGDPQVQHRGLKVEMPHPLAGHVPQVASPLRLSASPVDYRMPPPLLGEHSEALLQRLLGMSGEQIASLRQAGVI